MVHPEVGLEVQKQDGLHIENTRELVQRKQSSGNAQVREEDEGRLILAEDTAHGSKVALSKNTGLLVLERILAGREVQQQVQGPAEQLVEDKGDELVDGGVLEKLELGERLAGVFLARLRHENHVLLHVAGELVVARVAELPRVVRHAEEGVGEEANHVVEARDHREGPVARLVPEDPDAHADEALDEAVDGPGTASHSRVGDERDVGRPGPADGARQDDIADEVAQGAQGRRLEAVLGDRGTERLEVGEDGRRGRSGCVDLGVTARSVSWGSRSSGPEMSLPSRQGLCDGARAGHCCGCRHCEREHLG